MTTTLEMDSILNDHYQTTIPEAVRRALKLKKRDKIHYVILPGGAVLLTSSNLGGWKDQELRRFLGLLAQDITEHPEGLQALDSSFVQRVQFLARALTLI